MLLSGNDPKCMNEIMFLVKFLCLLCAEAKKSKSAKPPCNSDAFMRERTEQGRDLVAGRREGERGGEGEREGGERIGEVGGEVGEGEGEGREGGEGGEGGVRQGDIERIGKNEATIGTEDGAIHNDQSNQAMSALCNSDSTTVNGEVPYEGDVPVIQQHEHTNVGSPCSSQPRLELDGGRSSPLAHPSSLSPPEPSAAAGAMCEEGGGGEGGMAVTMVMSEEDEGPLDSSMEELPSSPPVPVAPIVAAVDTDGEIKYPCPCLYRVI